MPDSRTLRLTDANSRQVAGFTVAVRPEGTLWHWGVVNIMCRVLGSGDVSSLVDAQRAAEAALPLRIRRRLAANVGSDRRH